MVDLIKYLNRINEYFDEIQNPLVANFWLSSNFYYALVPALVYIYLVKFLGPKLMENRKPFKLRNTLIYYNLFQVILSIYLFVEGGLAAWFGKYNYHCQPLARIINPETMRVANVGWVYLFAKYTELLDTIFFVMRKKFNQVTFLHVFHHSSMVVLTWIGLKIAPGGHATFMGWLNSFVHIVMYFYYFLSAFGPHMQPYLGWKKYITILQMVQFSAIIIHVSQALIWECDYPKALSALAVFQAGVFLFLFSNFYVKTYYRKSKIL